MKSGLNFFIVNLCNQCLTETRTVQCALGWHRIATTFIQAVHKVQHWSTPIQQRIATVLIEAACERCPPLRTLEFQRLQRCVRDVDNEETYDSYYERGMSTTETGWPLKNLRIKNFNSRLNQIPDMLKNKEKSDVDDEDEMTAKELKN